MFPHHRLFVVIIVCSIQLACAGSSREVIRLPAPDGQNPLPLEHRPDNPDYYVGAGDVLLVSVWKDETLTRQLTVLPDGTISFPLIGQLNVNGLSLNQMSDLVKARLSRYVPDATLSIQVIQANSQVVYVIGKVTRPGRFELAGDMNILQALAVAGGPNPFAKSNQVKLFRYTRQDTLVFPFNYDEVVDGEHLEQNVKLERGDIIVVP